MIQSQENLFSLFILLPQHLPHSAELCKNVNNAGVLAKRNAKYAWGAHAHQTMPHTDAGRCTKRPFTTFHLIPVDRGKTGPAPVVLLAPPTPAVAEREGGERRDGSESETGSQGRARRGRSEPFPFLAKLFRGGGQ